MPKKFKGENSKAMEAKERKAGMKAEADAKKQAAADDAYWADDDKHVNKKLQRKVTINNSIYKVKKHLYRSYLFSSENLFLAEID